MFRIIVFTVFTTLVVAEKASYENYKVFRVTPTSEEHVELLKHLESLHENYTFWKDPSGLGQPVDLMVAPDQQTTFAKLMDVTEIKYNEYVGNVQNLLNNQNTNKRAPGLGWTSYHTLEEIYDWLESLAIQYPNTVDVIYAGRTYLGRTIKGVKLTFNKTATINNTGIFIEGGIRGRDWISPATVTYIINELLTNDDTAFRKFSHSYNWYLFPTFNPDGYVYSHTHNRFWSKTLRNIGNEYCFGVDANRNWDYKWMKNGASNDPCSSTYAGIKAFSEIETSTMSQYLRSISDKLFAYISFHSYGQKLHYPYGIAGDRVDNYRDLTYIGKEAIAGLKKVHGTQYTLGDTAETLATISGSSIDWVRSKLELPITFTYELRDTGDHGFLLPPKSILENCEEVMSSLVALFNEAVVLGYPKRIRK